MFVDSSRRSSSSHWGHHCYSASGFGRVSWLILIMHLLLGVLGTWELALTQLLHLQRPPGAPITLRVFHIIILHHKDIMPTQPPHILAPETVISSHTLALLFILYLLQQQFIPAAVPKILKHPPQYRVLPTPIRLQLLVPHKPQQVWKLHQKSEAKIVEEAGRKRSRLKLTLLVKATRRTLLLLLLPSAVLGRPFPPLKVVPQMPDRQASQ